MKKDDTQPSSQAIREMLESYAEIGKAVKASGIQLNQLRKLSRQGNKSRLVKIGVSLIVFPEPTPISETVGACFVTAGLIQQGIKNRSSFIDDIPKALKQTRDEIRSFRQSIDL